MTDVQILTIAIAVVVPLVAVLYSNKRIDDIHKRLDDIKGELMRHMDNGFEHLELLLKLHESEHHK